MRHNFSELALKEMHDSRQIRLIKGQTGEILPQGLDGCLPFYQKIQ